MIHPNEIELALRELVEALNKTYWSSWQSTANFSQQLEDAETLLSKLDDARGL